MKILVTGGLGYIGSHTVVELLAKGYEVVIVDNCMNSSSDVVERIHLITGVRPAFEQKDVRIPQEMQEVFDKHADMEGVIHFAASKSVEESMRNPLLYYHNNVNGLTYLLKEVERCERQIHFVFSSSCTVYGVPRVLPIAETAPLQPAASPYGYTKKIGETMVQDACLALSHLQATILRYFNPIGGHPSGEIGESPSNASPNLVPILVGIVAQGGGKKLQVYGGDYPTPDGTCVRDYVHVADLAAAHVLALEELCTNPHNPNTAEQQPANVYNIGTGVGTSVLELIQTFEKATGIAVDYEVVDRRSGDVPAIYADGTLATQRLAWSAERTLDEALLSAWRWQQRNSKKK